MNLVFLVLFIGISAGSAAVIDFLLETDDFFRNQERKFEIQLDQPDRETYCCHELGRSAPTSQTNEE